MGAARDIPVYRVIAPANQGSEGVSGRSAGYIVDTGTYRTRRSNNNNGTDPGSYFNDGETWYGITATRLGPSSQWPGRISNWHDVAVTGYSWGSISALAEDCALPNGTLADGGSTGYYSQMTFEYTGSCPGAVGGSSDHKHFQVPRMVDALLYQFNFYKIKFKADCTGTFTMWVQNSTTSLSDGPVIDLANIRNLTNVTGYFPGCQFWHGCYISGGFLSGPNIQIDHMLSMWGQSWQQAWDDAPVFVQYQANTTTSNISTCASVGAINTSTFPIPAAIAAQLSDPPSGGGGGGGTTGQLGKVTVGGAFNNAGTPYAFCNKITVPANKTYKINDLQVYVGGNSAITGSENLKAIIWNNSGSLPSTVNAVLGTFTIAGGGGGTLPSWVTVTPDSPPSLAGGGSGTDYWIGFIDQGTSGAAHIAYDAGAAGSEQYKQNSSYSTITAGDSFGAPDGTTTNVYSLFVDWTDVTSGAAPVNTTPPIATVLAVQGQVLTSDNGVWASSTTPTYTYQWQRDTAGNLSFSDIDGETAAAHTCVLADVGCHLRCNVTATNGTGSTTAASNNSVLVTAAVPTLLTPVQITGDGRVGNTLTVIAGTWTNSPTLTYQWQRDSSGNGTFTNISAQTATTYTLVLLDLGCTVRVVETATNTGGSATNGANLGPVAAAPTAPGTPPNQNPVVLPAVTGAAAVLSGIKTSLTEPDNDWRDIAGGRKK